ncbi:MAG: DUF2071 domain-containing protein [Bacteroidetes bacterium]|nr:DUF2071 domain-containing protein [Bacteroidota bacterium]
MKIPTIKGIIDRRILINYIVDPAVIAKHIPKPFKPQLYKGKAIVGICLIRLKQVRPKGFPGFVGLSSENGAHRIAVEWEENGEMKTGVYIPRRDSSSLFNHLVGGRVFPGKHYRAKFDVEETNGHYKVAFHSSDKTSIAIHAQTTNSFHPTSIFETLENVSDFMKSGALGYSPKDKGFDGLLLKTKHWKVEPLHVLSVSSSFFENAHHFPIGSVQFDNALLMTGIEHEWDSVPDKAACL